MLSSASIPLSPESSMMSGLHYQQRVRFRAKTTFSGGPSLTHFGACLLRSPYD